MYKVTVEFLDNAPTDTFYAEDTYSEGSEGRMVYWVLENADILSYPTYRIKKIVEKEVSS